MRLRAHWKQTNEPTYDEMRERVLSLVFGQKIDECAAQNKWHVLFSRELS